MSRVRNGSDTRMSKQGLPNEDEHRYVNINDPDANEEYQFCSNVVVTSKYSVVSFLPKFLFETFRKLANSYFLVVSGMQMIKPISNTNGFPSTLPTLMGIVGIDMVFAILEDRRRHQSDAWANASPCRILKGRQFQDSTWKNVVVGDILKIKNYDVIPADVMLISTSGEGGLCYVETKSLDGETNLKIRQSMEATSHLVEADMESLHGKVTCELPNNAINKFTGTLTYEGIPHPISPSCMLLRGCTLRNTECAFGVVVNTGPETKIMQAASSTPSKWSSIEKDINRELVRIVVVLFCFCFIGACANAGWNAEHLDRATYLQWNNKDAFEKWVIQFFYYFLLMYQFIPVSLYVSMTTVKFAQAYFMQKDLSMYHEETDTPAMVRTMALNEELGQVQYIFSDKTGTLTCNIMDFRKCSINGKSYGYGTTEIGMAALRRVGKAPSAEDLEAAKHKSTTPYVNFHGPELFADLHEGASGQQQQQFVKEFFTHLAVCHTVVAEKLDDGEVRLSASSPDEQALVAGAQFFGFNFVDRGAGEAHIMVSGADGTPERAVYQVLDVLEFNSTRKRMSAVVRDPSGQLLLYCKGADMVIWPRIAEGGDAEAKKAVTSDHMEAYAGDGLRTLAIAMRHVSEEEYEAWGPAFKQANGDLEQIELRKKNLPNRIDELMEQMECNLTLLGATAIEDKLQEGVPGCIADLAVGGIKIWVLTGDKEETAINIGFACQLLDSGMNRIVINMDTCASAQDVKDTLDRGARRARRAVDMARLTNDPDQIEVTWALVIDGEALDHALTEKCRYSLLRFAQYCKAVVACRVSPAQKALMVRLVKNNLPAARTLAIGDGANDVAMIQAAHLGVGISGQEGMQAVNASDYAIAQFRFLKPLLLVHGRFNYRRMSKLVVYMFYKNVLLTLVQFFFTLNTGSSGQKWYAEWGIQLYNVMYTALPIILIGVLDQDVSRAMAMALPRLYRGGSASEYFNTKVLWSWMVTSLYDAFIIYAVPVAAYHHASGEGQDVGLWSMGMMCFTLVIVITNMKLLYNQYSFYWFSLPILLLSILSWFACAFLFSGSAAKEYFPESFGVAQHVLGLPSFWFVVPLTVSLTIGRDFLVKGLKREFWPEYYHLVQEVVDTQTPVTPGTPGATAAAAAAVAEVQDELVWRLPEPPLAVVEPVDAPPLGLGAPGEDEEDVESGAGAGAGAGGGENPAFADKYGGIEGGEAPKKKGGLNLLKKKVSNVIHANRFKKKNHGFAFGADPVTAYAEAQILGGRGRSGSHAVADAVNNVSPNVRSGDYGVYTSRRISGRHG